MSKVPLSKQNFEHLDLPNLLINIWSYNDESHRNCLVCKQYERWFIEVAKKIFEVANNKRKYLVLTLGKFAQQTELKYL